MRLVKMEEITKELKKLQLHEVQLLEELTAIKERQMVIIHEQARLDHQGVGPIHWLTRVNKV